MEVASNCVGWALFSHPGFELKIPSHDFVEQLLWLAMLGFSPRPSDISDHFPEKVPRIQPVALKKPTSPATSWSPKTPVTPVTPPVLHQCFASSVDVNPSTRSSIGQVTYQRQTRVTLSHFGVHATTHVILFATVQGL